MLSYMREMLYLSATASLFVLSYQIVDPVLTLYMRQMGSTELDVGLILATSYVILMFLRIPSGLLSNKIGRKSMIFIAIGLRFFSVLLLYLDAEPDWLYLLLPMYYLPIAFFWSSSAALASEIAPREKRGEALGLYLTSFGAAMFSGPLICSLLTTFIDYGSLLLILLPLSVGDIVLLSRVKAEEKIHLSKTSDDHERVHNFFASLKRIVEAKNVRTLFLVELLSAVPVGIFSTLFSIYVKEELLVAPSLIALLFAFRGGANAFIRMPIGRFSDRLGSRRKPLIGSFVFYITAFAIITVTGSLPLIGIGMALFGIAWGIKAAVSNTFLIENVGPTDRGLGLSLFITMLDAGTFTGSLLAGFLALSFRATHIFGISILLFVFSFFLAVVGTEDMRKS